MFAKTKEQVLAKIDKSKKGSVDEPIKPLLTLINALKDYYTTSSCSGRILVITIKDKKRKDLAEFLLNAHIPITKEQLQTTLSNSQKEEVWLLVQPPILHVVASHYDKGVGLLHAMRGEGCKRAGIISSTNGKTVVEIKGSEAMELPLAKNGVILVDSNYLEEIVREANTKLQQSHKTLGEWESVFQNLSA